MKLISVQPFNCVNFYSAKSADYTRELNDLPTSFHYFKAKQFNMLFPNKPVYGQVFRSTHTHLKLLPELLRAYIWKSPWCPL